jgi:hypothetical protein
VFDSAGFDLVFGFAFFVEAAAPQGAKSQAPSTKSQTKSEIKGKKPGIAQAQMSKHKYQIKFKIKMTGQKGKIGQTQMSRSFRY